jgi:hypothetical protein
MNALPTTNFQSRQRVFLILTLLALFMGLMRLHTYDEPFERDITTHAVIAHELLNGKILYQDIFSDRTPLIQWTYAFGEVIMGFGLNSIYFLWYLSALITLGGVYACATASGGRSSVGLWAAGFWVLISCAPMVQANQPNSEVFINNCIIWVFALILRDDGKGNGLIRALGIGVLLAVASLYKSHVLVLALALGIAHIVKPPGGVENRKRSIIQAGTTAGVGVCIWSGLFVYMYATGRFEYFWNDIYTFMQHYTGDIGENIRRGIHPQNLLPHFLFGIFPLIVLSVLGAGLNFKKHSTRSGTLYACYGFSIALMVALPGKFFPHYYQFWLPFLALSSAKILETLAFDNGQENTSGLKSMGTAIAILLVALQIRYYSLDSREWALIKYGNLFVDTQRVGRMINDVLKEDETFYNWGLDSGLHFYSEKPIPSGAGMWPLVVMGGPLAKEYMPRIQADLIRNNPELLIVADYLPKQHPLFQWLLTRYEVFPDNTPYLPFEFYFRKGGKLEKRLDSGEKS